MNHDNIKINIQVFGSEAQVSMANGYNTDRMTRKQLQILINDALIAERAMADAEIAKKPKLKAVS